MAEVLDISQTLDKDYEPKRSYQWVMDINGLDTWTIRTANRPSLTTGEIELPYINNRKYYPGRSAWDTLDIEVLDVIAPSAADKAMVWLRSIHNDETNQDGYRSAITRRVVLKLLGPDNTVVEKWELINTWPTTIDFGTTGLDYDSDDVLKISMTLRFDYAKLISV